MSDNKPRSVQSGQVLNSEWLYRNGLQLGLVEIKSVRNFCETCGKRLGGLEHVHTCTPSVKENE